VANQTPPLAGLGVGLAQSHLQQDFGQLRGLAGASFTAHHHHRVLPDGLSDVLTAGTDGQTVRKFNGKRQAQLGSTIKKREATLSCDRETHQKRACTFTWQICTILVLPVMGHTSKKPWRPSEDDMAQSVLIPSVFEIFINWSFSCNTTSKKHF
jgi:hypothetical protein